MEKINTVNQVKNHNVYLIKKALKSVEAGTKNTIARMTGLSIATCNTILNELAQKHEILEVESEGTTVGRPPKMYRFNESFSYICCIFLDVDGKTWKLEYAITDLLGNIREESNIDCEEISVDVIVDALKVLMKKEPKIQTVCFGSPGYCYDNQIHSRGVPQLEGINLEKELKERLECKVYIENDMNAMAYGMYWYGGEKIPDNSSLVMVAYFEDARIGSGIVLDGKIVHGKTGFAGEIARINYGKEKVQDMVMSGKEGIVKAASIVVECYSAVLNPDIIVFTGSGISEEFFGDIVREVEKYIPKEHIPQLIYMKDFRKYFIRGLTAIALEVFE